MDQLPSNIRKDLLKLIPVSVYNEVICFDLYDNHPSDSKSIEVIVCTKRGEIIEFYKREVVQSYTLQNSNITEIKVIRNKRCNLFYLVQADDKIFLLSRKEIIDKFHEVDNVNSYSLDDAECRGRPRLKIIKNDDAVPLVFDDNFEHLEEQLVISENPSRAIPLLEQLKRKLTEAQYCVKFNEDKYKQLVSLRQQAIFHMYESGAKDLNVTLKVNDIANLLQIETRHPEVKLCNKKILIIINLLNKNSVSLEDVGIILHNTLKKTTKYKTKLYTDISLSPYWKEKEDRTIEPNKTVCVVAVIDLEELQNYANSKVDFEIVISYSKEGKCLLLPFDKVHISATDIMGENFDVLARSSDDRITLLCILSSDKDTLHLQHLPSNSAELVTLYSIFCTHLKMEQLFENVAIHKLSPYHPLHGVMVVFTKSCDNRFDIDVYTRSPSQILSLIHYIYDAVPHRIIVLTKEMKMLPPDGTLTDVVEDNLQDLNMEELGKSIIHQTTVMKEYFDECLVKMNESKNPLVQAKVGREIDIVALGKDRFLEFRKNILDSTERGIDGLNKIKNENESEDMEL